MTDFVVAKVSDVPEGKMKEVVAGEGKVLLINNKGNFYATGTKCSHYGAPLVNGALTPDGRLRCQWHGACFNYKTGDIEDMPGLDSLASFKVRVEGENIIVTATKEELASGKKTVKACKHIPGKTAIIVGGGAAGVSAAESLRSHGFDGRIVLICKEKHLPYDRAKLSKMLNAKPEQLQWRNADFFKNIDVEVLSGATVTELDSDAKTVKLNDGSVHKYDVALVATGGEPTTLPLKGIDSKNVHVLRTIDQANQIDSEIAGNDVVVVGSSFIGMEIAANAVSKAKSVTVIARSDVPFKQSLGDEIGKAWLNVHQKNKVNFLPNASIKELKIHDGKVTSLILGDGKEIPCQLLIFGVGVSVQNTTKFIKHSANVKIDKDGSIIVDKHLKAADGLYAAGDVARYPDAQGHLMRIEHWGVAQNQGQIAGANMAGKPTVYNKVPYFWTMMYGKGLRYCGHAASFDEIVYDKEANGLEPDTLKFVAFYCKDGKIVAVASVARDPVVSQCAELMHHGKMFDVATLKKAIAEKKLADILVLH